MNAQTVKTQLRSRFSGLSRIGVFAWRTTRLALPWTESAFFRCLRRLRSDTTPILEATAARILALDETGP